MRKGWVRAFALLVAAMLALSACGGGDKDKGGEAASCEGSAVSQTGLPSDFPVPDAVTFTEARTDGPSQVAEGFATEDLEGMYNEWKDILDQESYSVLFSEKEEDDAEISYEGPTSTGQVALRNDCGEGKVFVHVTSRPK
jgi:ABC-type glycerol-3-phosphate transport system substrate-binding protein